jgi:hypothetical protein
MLRALRPAPVQAEQEEKERRKRDKAEAHLYSLVRVATDADMREQIGATRFFDLVDHDKVRCTMLCCATLCCAVLCMPTGLVTLAGIRQLLCALC